MAKEKAVVELCSDCQKPLAVVYQAEYSGAKAWPYYYCSNPKCESYQKER